MKTLAIYLTGACNLRCKHCSVGFDQYRPRQALSDDDIIRVLDRAREREVEFITFLGGEPFYSPHDLPRIFGHAEALGKTVIMGALSLYINFINIFVMLLQLMGDRR